MVAVVACPSSRAWAVEAGVAAGHHPWEEVHREACQASEEAEEEVVHPRWEAARPGSGPA